MPMTYFESDSQDEVGDLFHGLGGHGVLDTRFRGYNDRVWRAAARHFSSLHASHPHDHL